MLITKHDSMRIAVETFCDLRTIQRAYQGKGVHMSSWTRISLAAERLGLPTPPAPVYRDDERLSSQPTPAVITSLRKPQA